MKAVTKMIEDKKFYLIAKKLSHSFSPLIHKRLQNYSYSLCPLEETELDEFFRKRDFDGLNVTIPYKETVIKYLDFISPEARKIGACNTVVKRDGRLYGYNTDYYGFMYMLKKSGIEIKGKDAVVVGNGGASKTVVQVLRDLSAKRVRIITRSENTPTNIQKYFDAQILVNASPVGMFPDTEKSPVELEKFTKCLAVFDLIYNPSRTRLIQTAEKMGIAYENGLSMLVAQAKKASEFFTGKKLRDSLIPEIQREIEYITKNIILIGMPGCGKSTVGNDIAKILKREMLDSDTEIEKNYAPPSEIIETKGEKEFRKIETSVLSQICKKSGLVIATGGGAVTISENFEIIRQNSVVVFIKRPLADLSRRGRPLSKGKGALEKMWQVRSPLYEKFADIEVESQKNRRDTAKMIIEKVKKGI